MRISDWSSDVCSSDLGTPERVFTSVGRRTMTRHDPMLFALVYCRNLITDDSGHVSFAELHLELCRYVQKWKEPIDALDSRTAFVALREVGKSFWVFKIVPLWAAAHEHVKFIAVFSSSATQAEIDRAGFNRDRKSTRLNSSH